MSEELCYCSTGFDFQILLSGAISHRVFRKTGPCSPILLHEVDHIHARAAKIIYRLSDVSNQEAITIAGWELINSMYKRKLLNFIYQVYKSELPDNGEAKYQAWCCRGYNIVVVVVFSLWLSMTNTFSSIVQSRYLYLTTRLRIFLSAVQTYD